MKQESTPVACDLSALDAAQRERHVLVARQFLASIEEVEERPDGYAFRLPADAEVIRLAAEFISRERLCCPFLRFRLEVAPEQGPIWCELTGRSGAKALLAEILF